MNLATTQVKNSVDLRSANNGTILKSSVVSSFGLSLDSTTARRAEIFSGGLGILCLRTRAKNEIIPAY